MGTEALSPESRRRCGAGGRRGSLGVRCCRKEGSEDDWAFSGDGEPGQRLMFYCFLLLFSIQRLL